MKNCVKSGAVAHLFSIGHSNRTLDSFLALLRAHQIDVLVDVRSQPYSKYAPQFNGPTLEAAIKGAGMKFLSMGKEIGGRPDGAEFYDENGFVLYYRVARSPLFLAGIQRLVSGAQRYHVAIACSEENPAGCHRRLLIGRVLAERGVELRHIRGDGRVETEADLLEDAPQLHLFEETEQQRERAWKSIRSVSPGGKPPTSSEH